LTIKRSSEHRLDEATLAPFAEREKPQLFPWLAASFISECAADRRPQRLGARLLRREKSIADKTSAIALLCPFLLVFSALPQRNTESR
jgi:hypothetical protein